MMVVPISRSDEPSYAITHKATSVPHEKPADWTHLVAAGTLIAGGVLIATGHRRAGLAVAAAGTAVALIEEQEAVAGWWKGLPQVLNNAQHFLDKAEVYLKEASVQGHRLQSLLRR
jgi:hypothetical protein